MQPANDRPLHARAASGPGIPDFPASYAAPVLTTPRDCCNNRGLPAWRLHGFLFLDRHAISRAEIHQTTGLRYASGSLGLSN